jgi:hypothetical protein
MKGEAMLIYWITYNGTPETMPRRDKAVLVHDGVAFLNDMRKGLCWDFDDRAAVPIEVGDQWAYLPTPPETK